MMTLGPLHIDALEALNSHRDGLTTAQVKNLTNNRGGFGNKTMRSLTAGKFVIQCGNVYTITPLGIDALYIHKTLTADERLMMLILYSAELDEIQVPAHRFAPATINMLLARKYIYLQAPNIYALTNSGIRAWEIIRAGSAYEPSTVCYSTPDLSAKRKLEV